MKIPILFIDFCPVSGSSQGLLSEIDFINRRYSNKYICILAGPYNSIFKLAAKRMNFKFYEFEAIELVDFHRSPLKIVKIYIVTFISLMRVVIKHKVRLIHCNHYMWSIYANPVGFLLRKPVIIHLKDVWRLEPKIARVLMKFNPQTRYIAVSKYVKQLFCSKYKINYQKTVMIYDGIDNKIFSPILYKQIHEKFNSKNKIFIMMSRVAPERDIEVFIDVAALLRKNNPSFRFTHYGFNKYITDNKYYKSLQDRVTAVGLNHNFEFVEYQSDPKIVAAILKAAFLTLVPARRFALPNTAIESMLSGTPVIANNVGGNPEIIANNSLGTLVKINSPVLFEDAIENYLIDYNKYLNASIKGLAYTLEFFSADKQFEKIVDLYDEQLKRKIY
jgi:glycosyltransferase involved in cell wall biosynthesis